MTSEKRTRAIGVGLAGLAIAVAVFLSRSTSRPPDATPSPPETAAGASDPAPSSVPMRATSREAPAEVPSSPASATPDLESDPSPGETRGFRVRGRVLGRDENGCPSASITVTAADWTTYAKTPAIHGTTDAAGEFVVEVGAIFDSGPTVTALQVAADHPEYLPGRARFQVDSRPSSGGVEWRADVQLVTAAFAEGRVLGEWDEPVKGATVAAWDFTGEEPEPVEGDRAETSSDGAYRLRIAADGPVFIVAQAPGRLPASEAVSLTRSHVATVPPLRLERGVSIGGRVRWSGGDPIAGVTVAARKVKGTPQDDYRFLHSEIAASNGRVVRAGAAAPSDAAGEFEIEGLEPGHYKVWIEEIPEAHLAVARATPMREADAPSGGVDFVCSAARLTILVQAAGEPVARARIMLLGPGGGQNRETGPDGLLSMLVAPGARFHAMVYPDGFEGVRREIHAPLEGEEATTVIDLEPPRPRPALVVNVENATETPIDRIGVVLYPVEPADYHDRWGDRGSAHVENGVFRVEGLTPGHFRLVVRPGGDRDVGGYFLDVETMVEVPPEGEVAVTVAARPAGRMSVAARDEHGRMLPAACTVRDSAGTRMDVWIVNRAYGGMGGSSSIAGEMPCDVEPSLPPGRYSVEFALEGFAPRTIEVDVVAGRTVPAETTLTSGN